MNYQNFFEVFFQKVFLTGCSQPHLPLIMSMLIRVSLSKAGAKLLLYNIYSKLSSLFFRRKCDFFPKSLILKRCRAAYFSCVSFRSSLPNLNIYHARVYKKIRRNCLHSCHRKATACVPARNRWQQTATSPCTRCTKVCPSVEYGGISSATCLF